jgi:hypothetical protein
MLHINPEVTGKKMPDDVDTLWGVEAIARFIDCPIRRAYYLIERGKLPVRKLSHRTIIASKAKLRDLAVPE